MRFGSRVFTSLIVLAGGCSFRVPGLVGVGGDGSSCAPQCVASPPGLIGCDGGAPQNCAFFCGGEDGGTAHCLQLVPGDVVQTADLARPGIKPLLLAGDATFNSDTGAVTGALTRPPGVGLDSASGVYFDTREQPAPYPAVGVFVLAGLTVRPGQTLHVRGSNAVAIVATQDSTVEGTIELQGDCLMRAAGPGGGAGGDQSGSGEGAGLGGGRPGSLSADGRGGGGGGTHGDQGGRGGNGSGTATGGQPGSAFADVQVGTLAGGGGGAAGTGAGGGGGGALHLVVGGQLTVRGAFQAGGCGGRGGGGTGAGGGGGAGGLLLIEAAIILLQPGSVLASNGGGGGSGDASTAGAAGTLDGIQAPGGAAGRRGGSGGAGAIAAGSPGMAAFNPGKNGGGGGGAAGRIALRTASGRLEPGSSAVLSPVPVGGPDSPATISAVSTR